MKAQEYTGQDISKGHVVLDFYSDTCVPCRAISARLDQYETTQYRIYKVNTASKEGRSFVDQFGIMSTPVFVTLIDGLLKDVIFGEAAIQRWLTEMEAN